MHDAQVAAGVPLMVGEPADYRAFRIGLFGLDKLADVDEAILRELVTRCWQRKPKYLSRQRDC